ncbi:unnamed protein product [Caenorhabditis brenneri]
MDGDLNDLTAPHQKATIEYYGFLLGMGNGQTKHKKNPLFILLGIVKVEYLYGWWNNSNEHWSGQSKDHL